MTNQPATIGNKAQQHGRCLAHHCIMCNKTYSTHAALYFHVRNQHAHHSYAHNALHTQHEPYVTYAKHKTYIKFTQEEIVNLHSLLSYNESHFDTSALISAAKQATRELFTESNLVKALEKYSNPIEKALWERDIDYVFAEYLFNLGERVSKYHYLKICKFFIYFRDTFVKHRHNCMLYNVESIPEFAMSMYHSELGSMLNLEVKKRICLDFCKWLYNNAYTSKRIVSNLTISSTINQNA